MDFILPSWTHRPPLLIAAEYENSVTFEKGEICLEQKLHVLMR